MQRLNMERWKRMQAKRQMLAAVVLCVGTSLHAQRGSTVSASARMSVPACTASDLSLGTDAENGSFNGMSHSGTLLVLRNLSPRACSVPARPQIVFLDGVKQLDLKLVIPGAKFMHPGPVMLPVVIAPDAEVTAKLRWVSGEVYDNSLCMVPTAIGIKLGEETQQVEFKSRICGDRTQGVTYEATPLVPDPQFRP